MVFHRMESSFGELAFCERFTEHLAINMAQQVHCSTLSTPTHGHSLRIGSV